MTIIKILDRVFEWFGTLGWLELFGALVVAFGCLGEFWILANKLTQHIEPIGKASNRFWRSVAWLDSKLRPVFLWLKINGRKIPKAKEDLLERLFVILVAIGVTIEFICLPFSLNEVADLNVKAGQAYDQAVNTESTNLGLRAHIVELEKEMAKTKANVANLDPLKEPVTRVSAFVKLVGLFPHMPDMTGKAIAIYEKPSSAGTVGELTFFNKTNHDSMSLFLSSLTLNKLYEDGPEMMTFFMQFQFQYANTHKLIFSQKGERLIPTEMLGVKAEIITNFDSVSLKLFAEPIADRSQLNGTATLVLNSISREFPLRLQDPSASPLVLQ